MVENKNVDTDTLQKLLVKLEDYYIGLQEYENPFEKYICYFVQPTDVVTVVMSLAR